MKVIALLHTVYGGTDSKFSVVNQIIEFVKQ